MRSVVFVLTLAATLQGQVLKQGFEVDTEGWMAMGTSASVKVSKDAKAGLGALQFSYSLDGKGANTAILPLSAGRLGEMRRLRFWVKADHDTAVAVALSAKKTAGGDYAATVWLSKNVWQHVELSLADFTANDAPNDAVNSDRKLDPERIEGIGLVDLASFFNHLPDTGPMLVTRTVGWHSLKIDDFEIAGGADSGVPNKPGTALIDSFGRGFSQWITTGGMSLRLSPPNDNPLGAPALEAAIRGIAGKVGLLIRRANGAELVGGKRIVFDVAAEREGTFVLMIEIRQQGSASGQGPRYNFMFHPPEGRKVFRVNVSLADFEFDANSPEDLAGKLEPGRIKSISIGEVTGLAGGSVQDNKIWIGRMEIVKSVGGTLEL